MEEYLKFAKEIAQEAGKIILYYFEKGAKVEIKRDRSVVTEADKEINTLLIKEVRNRYPNHSVFGEEESLDNSSEYAWVCDPLDGTVPFICGLPVSVFSLALVKDGVPIVGVVYNPFLSKFYTGILGKGAHLNDFPIHVSNKGLDRQSTIDIEVMPWSKYDFTISMHEVSKKTGVYLLQLGSTIHACCLVASGSYEACVFDGSKGKNYDIAAIKVIVEEAGGLVTDLFGKDQRYDRDIKGAIVSNGVVHQELLGLVSEE